MRTALVKSLIAVAAVMAAGSAAAVGAVSGQGTWETTLESRDIDNDGTVDAYYDKALNISWLANANANPEPDSQWGIPGFATFDEATSWAANLNVGGVTGWHLPTINIDACGPDDPNELTISGSCGYNVDPTTSQMAHMFSVTLGNTSIPHLDDGTLTNTGPFSNLMAFGYWFSKGYTTWQGNQQDFEGWRYSFHAGRQDPVGKSMELHSWAVHDGDVGALAPVPEPETYSMMLAGLGAMALVARRRRKI